RQGSRTSAPVPSVHRTFASTRRHRRPGRGTRRLRSPVRASPPGCRTPARRRGAGRRVHTGGGSSLLQRLEPQPVRAGVLAEATLLVFLVLAVVALEELHVRVALEGEDVGRDAVEEPA